MSEGYSPDPAVAPTSADATVFLSQRDLSLQVPINYVTVPGVSVTTACFSHGTYEDDRLSDCLSNLLVMNYNRLVVDIFWDEGRSVWSLCPAALPLSSTVSPSSKITSGTSITSISSSSSSNTSLRARQAETNSAISSSGLPTPTQSSDSTSTRSLLSAIPSTLLSESPNGTDLAIGPYNCTDTIQLSTLTNLLLDYLQKTEDDLTARLIYLTINVHAAANNSSPQGPVLAPTSLPGSEDSLGAIFASNFSSFIYTPNNLFAERANLNNSWYKVVERFRPAEEYYTTSKSSNGIVSSEDGWATEYYIEFSQSKRLLVDFGTVDPQMLSYKISDDGDTIFGNNYLHNDRSTPFVGAKGTVEAGCFVTASNNQWEVNSSWATASTNNFEFQNKDSSNLQPLLDLGSNLTLCGISPIMNTSLINITADTDHVPYQKFTHTTIWSWAPGQPKNYTDEGADDDSLFRCATISHSDPAGRWVVSDCSSKHYTACQAIGQPYNWSISTYVASYSYASRSCPDGYTFAAPRTALENSVLNQTVGRSNRGYDGHGTWIDLNSLDVKGCWVANNGPNATCPYSDGVDDLNKKYVVVPAIAALIVLSLTGLMVFGKLAGNRKVGKRAKRRVGADVYEGVPS